MRGIPDSKIEVSISHFVLCIGAWRLYMIQVMKWDCCTDNASVLDDD